MSYITLGNLTRFLNKLKTYIGNNYLKLTGGTVTGDTIFRKKISAHEVCLTGLSDVSLINKGNGFIAKDGLTILDEGNYNLFTPTLHGTGATGTWDISISGNALNDSEGNKIVDTYAKKSDIPTGSNITVDDALSATSTNPVQNKVVNGALNKKLSTDGGMVHGNVRVLGDIKATSLSIGDVAAIVTLISGGTGAMAREQDGKLYTFLDTSNYTKYVPKLDGNGHLIINGSELWIA